jgi:small-conductance mechanosensitive channel
MILIYRPFDVGDAMTSDYWRAYWDITRAVKKRFDEEGISIPFPQQDMHIYHHGDGPSKSAL